MRLEYYEQFYKIPISLLQNEKLSPNAKLLMSILLSLSYNENEEYEYNGSTNVGNEYLCKLLRISDSQVFRLLKELKDNNYIKIEASRFFHNNQMFTSRTIYINENMFDAFSYGENYSYLFEKENEDI